MTDKPRPDGSKPLTDEELDDIEARNDTLYELNQACVDAGANWRSDYAETNELMLHFNTQFPGYDIRLLLIEVRRLRTLVDEGDWQGDADIPMGME